MSKELTDETELTQLRRLLKRAAFNMCWMAEKIHQGHHQDQAPNWRACTMGVCASMSHLLAEIGFTPDMEPTEVKSWTF